jgi:tape measure domain-containing protein
MDTDVELKIGASVDDTAASGIESLLAKIDQLTAEIEQQRQVIPATTKDWADYAEQTINTTESLTNIASGLEDVSIKAAEIGTAIVVYQKWRTLVETVQEAHAALQTALETATSAASAGVATLESGWGAVQLQTEKLEAKLGSLTARFLEFGKIAEALSTAGIVLTLAQIGVAADESNEKTRLLTEQIGGLTASLQALDPASKRVELAKERFEELYKASLNLGTPIEKLLPTYKAFFDQTDEGSLSLKVSAEALTDFLNVQKSLAASSTEAETAQKNVTAAFDAGVTSVAQLSTIFGSALNPALDAVASRMGITREQLQGMINTGQLGTEAVFPALAAAARNVTADLSSASEAAAFTKQQFDAMGLSFYDLSASKLPGVTTALQYTQREIATTVDASVDPIGAAVEQIVNFGDRLVEWGRVTKQSIADVFTGPDIGKALTTGLQESMYALDLILVSARSAITATGESLGILAGAAVTATNPTEALSETWARAGDNIEQSRAKLQGYIDALEGVDNASGRTTAATQALAEAAKSLPELKLPEKLQDIIDKMTATQKASEQVGAAWRELTGLDFTSKNLQGLLILRQTIEEVSVKTKDATGTQEAFARQLATLPTAQFDALLTKVTALQPALQAAGDKGQLFGAIMGAAFQKTIEAAAQATVQNEAYVKSVVGILTLEEKRAQNAAAVITALGNEGAAFQAAADKAALHAQAMQAEAVQKQTLADASAAVYAQLQQEVAGNQALTETQTKQLAAAKADATQKAIVAAQAREVATAAQLEAAQLTGVNQAHLLSFNSASQLVSALEDLKQRTVDTSAAVEILTQNEKDGIATKDQLNAAIAAQIAAFTQYNTAIDLTQKEFAKLGLDAQQVLTGMDAKFRETITVLQDLATNGKLTGAVLTEALNNAIKTANSQAELKALDTLIKQLGQDGKLAGGEMTLALDAVKAKLNEITAATDPVAQAFAKLGINSAASLKQAAQEAQDAFTIIKTSATATAGDVDAAFAAMAAKVLEAGNAAGPVGLAMAEASLRAKAATEEQQQALEALIAKYDDSGKAATSAAAEQVQAANTAAAAIENYSTRVEARAGAGADAFRETTAAIQQTTVAANAASDSQQRQIQGYNDLSEAGKAWADSLIRQAMAADASQAGMLTYRDETGKTIREIQQQIETEKEAAATAEQLGVQYEDGAISASKYEFALRQLVFQMGDRVTAAGDEVAQKLKELEQQMQETQATVNAGVGGATGTQAPILNTTGIDTLTTGLKTVSTLLSEINNKAGVVGDNIAKQVTSSSYVVQAVVKELQLQAGRAN